MLPDFYVDNREPPAFRDSLIKEGFKLLKLDHGDVWCGPWVVERKKAEDFIASLTDGRLITQTATIRESNKKPLIVVEGDLRKALWFREKSEQLYLGYHGALATIVGSLQIPVVPTSDIRSSQRFILSLKHRVEDPITEIEVPIIKLKQLDPYHAMLAQIPQVGPKKAAQIASEYSSFSAFEGCHYYEIVEKFGPVTAENIWRVVKGRPMPFVYRAIGVGKKSCELVQRFPQLEEDKPAPMPSLDALSSIVGPAAAKKVWEAAAQSQSS